MCLLYDNIQKFVYYFIH